jgi:hypothetical protein
MNVLKPALQMTIKTLLSKEISQREIERKTGIDRKTIRRYARLCDLSATQGAEDSKSPTFQRMWPPARRPHTFKIPHPGHRLPNPNCLSMSGQRVNPTGSGLRIR